MRPSPPPQKLQELLKEFVVLQSAKRRSEEQTGINERRSLFRFFFCLVMRLQFEIPRARIPSRRTHVYTCTNTVETLTKTISCRVATLAGAWVTSVLDEASTQARTRWTSSMHPGDVQFWPKKSGGAISLLEMTNRWHAMQNSREREREREREPGKKWQRRKCDLESMS